MSFLISVYVNEGMVMASDSRTTYTRTERNEATGEERVLIGTHSTNSTDKLFLCPNGCGISTCGEANILNKPITGYIQNFIREKVNKNTKISDIPAKIIEYFQKFQPVPAVNFMIAGYEQMDITKSVSNYEQLGTAKNSKTRKFGKEHSEGEKRQRLFRVRVADAAVEEIDTSGQGATWDGETIFLTKLIQPTAIKSPEGEYIDMPYHRIAWEFFTLQDAADYARYAVETTIKTMHFHDVVETVGGSVDLLVITPEGAKWLEKKELT
ncbi:MAG: hypothetical protein ACRCUS_02270 [Anaerovoracaceae bacterium]